MVFGRKVVNVPISDESRAIFTALDEIKEATNQSKDAAKQSVESAEAVKASALRVNSVAVRQEQATNILVSQTDILTETTRVLSQLPRQLSPLTALAEMGLRLSGDSKKLEQERSAAIVYAEKCKAEAEKVKTDYASEKAAVLKKEEQIRNLEQELSELKRSSLQETATEAQTQTANKDTAESGRHRGEWWKTYQLLNKYPELGNKEVSDEDAQKNLLTRQLSEHAEKMLMQSDGRLSRFDLKRATKSKRSPHYLNIYHISVIESFLKSRGIVWESDSTEICSGRDSSIPFAEYNDSALTDRERFEKYYALVQKRAPVGSTILLPGACSFTSVNNDYMHLPVFCLGTRQIFKSINAAAKAVGCTPTKMARHLSGKCQEVNGYYFCYIDQTKKSCAIATR